MKPEFKKSWVDALRSGRYQQGQEALRSGKHTFCCLGVLCDLVDQDQWGSHHEGAWYFKYEEIYGMPDDVTFIATGISREEAQELADMNDGGTGFSEIANYIEEHL